MPVSQPLPGQPAIRGLVAARDPRDHDRAMRLVGLVDHAPRDAIDAHTDAPHVRRSGDLAGGRWSWLESQRQDHATHRHECRAMEPLQFALSGW